tara:strand:+ start:199 stop:504 length:306 start_codon:yes stop_codon:yes gene_type:complete
MEKQRKSSIQSAIDKIDQVLDGSKPNTNPLLESIRKRAKSDNMERIMGKSNTYPQTGIADRVRIENKFKRALEQLRKRKQKTQKKDFVMKGVGIVASPLKL